GNSTNYHFSQSSIPNAVSWTWSATNATINGPTNAPTFNITATGGNIVVTLVVRDSFGCTFTGTKNVTVNALPVPAISVVRNPVCAGSNDTASVTNAASFSSIAWTIQNGVIDTNPPSGATITFHPTGTADVILTATGTSSTCSRASTVTIPVLANTPAAITPSGPTTLCPNASVTLTASAGTSYLWSTGATTQSIAVSAQNTYSVDVTSANGCTSTASINITNTATPNVSIVANGPTRFCAGGSVTLTADDGGASGGTYLWSNGATTQSMAVTSGGSYSVTASYANGCSRTAGPTVVTVDPLPNATITGPAKLCLNGPITLSAPAGGASYLWSNGATTQSITVNAVGTFSVTVSNGYCSTASAPFTVTAGTMPESIGISGKNHLCPGETGTIWMENDPTHFASIVWTIENGTIVGANNGKNVTFTTGVVGTTRLVVRGYNEDGCYTGGVFDIVVGPPSSDITASPRYCAGHQTQAWATSYGSPDETHQWTITHATIVSGANLTAVDFVPDGTGDLTITHTVTAPFGCSSTSSVTVPVDSLPAFTIAAPATTCTRTGNTASVPDLGTGAQYYWSVVRGTITSSSRERSITYDIDPAYLSAQLHFVVFKDACIETVDKIVAVDDATATIATPYGTTFCAGGSVSLEANDGASWLWSNGATTRNITVATAGTYSVTVTTANGCSATSTPVVVNAEPAVAPQIVVTPAQTCPSQVDLQATVTNASSFVDIFWTSNAAQLPPYGGASISLLRGWGGGDTWIEARGITAAGCTLTTRVTIPEVPGPDPSITAPALVCDGELAQASVPDGGAGVTYHWELTNATIVGSANSRTIAFRPHAFNNNPANLYVEVSNAAGCTMLGSKNVTIGAKPVATISASGPTTFCEGGSVTLTASSAASYLWSNGSTAQSIVVSSAGSYSVNVTNAQGCSATSNATSVAVQSLPSASISASGPTTFCEGGSVTLTASSGASYLWSNGATTQSIVVSNAGSYSVTVTNAQGCASSSSATTVVVNALPVATISASGVTTFCEGGSVTLTASSGASYLWSNGATTQSIAVSNAGSYSVTVTNANGCSATSSATSVIVNALPVATISASGPTTFCEGGSVTLTASSGASHLWSNGATTQSINVTNAGSYSVTVTNANGCSATSGATSVTVNALPTATISASGPTTFCEGGSVTLTASSGASYLWSNGATTQSINVTSGGSYSVTVTNANGCSATSGATSVTVNALPTATISASGPTTFCEGGSVTFTASSGASYLWSNGATTQSINVTNAGSYSVTVTNANGCSATSGATSVTVNAL
ncbi:MAG TPA: hypothetical protein VMU84_05660, partial [Thermoanaerobaculia bacterium]|nr:hypothetical protein [Thermoanaerobaculia bacterium]